MLSQGVHVDLWDLVSPLARTFDRMSAALADHSLRVAYLALRLAEELGYPAEAQRELALAGALHDIGAFSLRERLDTLAFEEEKPLQHSRAGSLLLRGFAPFSSVASLVAFHHVLWDHGAGATSDGVAVPPGSHLLHLADRAAVRLSRDAEVLGQVSDLCDAIAERRGGTFVPAFVDALLRLAGRDYVWLDVASGATESALRERLGGDGARLDGEALLAFSRLLCRIIDFKSEFTATHSSGVAAAGRELARLVGFSPRECTMFEVAAYLHDVGKLAIPSEILEKPGRLTADEWGIMRTHVYHTYQILSPVEALGALASWSSLHQERLDGSGYPFGYTADQLPLGARIMAVADVFTGITEHRPYREGMTRAAATDVLRGMADRRELDGHLVDLLLANYEGIDGRRAAAQADAVREYDAFRAALG